MEFRIADTFTDSLARLASREQKAAKTTAFDLQLNPAAPGLKVHRIDRSKDQNFWSIRVSADIRIIVHRTSSSFLLAYVGHHDDAYSWAERRRIEEHPRTGAIQIVEVRERVEELAPPPPARLPVDVPIEINAKATAKSIFRDLSTNDLLSIGVPSDWVRDVHAATEDRFFELAAHLPAEAAERLLEFAATGSLQMKLVPSLTLPDVALSIDEPRIATDGTRGRVVESRHEPTPWTLQPYASAERDPFSDRVFDHPDTERRFRIIESVEDLRRALDYPWDKWTVFLHPSQRSIVAQSFAGPARVAGSAGTGKTVVALHRAAALVQRDPQARVLLTTFSRPLANMLERKLKILIGEDSSVVPRVVVTPFRGVAEELYQLTFGRRPHAPSDELVRSTLAKAAEQQGVTDFTARFLFSEWTYVVDAWQLDSAEAYANVPRLGRKNRMGTKQRARLWPIFAATRKAIGDRGFHTWPQIFAEVTAAYASREQKPFTQIVVDEAQDLGVPELRLFAAIASSGANSLFFAGDLGQRIFQQPFSWTTLGVDVRGRSSVLTVNYRTSHQIRQAADRLMPKVVRDVDGVEEERFGTVSIFNGPEPLVKKHADAKAEIESVALWISEALAAGIGPFEIGIFVRSRNQIDRARAAVHAAGHDALELSERGDDPASRISIGTMHLAKGLEFKAVAVMACDDDVLPLQSRVESVADEVELDDVYETERQLLYVACTRARDRLLITAVNPASEFLNDLLIST